MPQNFDPYIDWQAMNEKMVDDFHDLLVRFKSAQDDLLKTKSKEKVIEVIKLQIEMSRISAAIQQTLFVMPVMVHVAGEKTKKLGEDGSEQVSQRCQRCGSVLQFWKEGYAAATPTGPIPLDEDDLPWWSKEDLVAKATNDSSATMYGIDKERPLKKYEMSCPDLKSLTGDSGE